MNYFLSAIAFQIENLLNILSQHNSNTIVMPIFILEIVYQIYHCFCFVFQFFLCNFNNFCCSPFVTHATLSFNCLPACLLISLFQGCSQRRVQGGGKAWALLVRSPVPLEPPKWNDTLYRGPTESCHFESVSNHHPTPSPLAASHIEKSIATPLPYFSIYFEINFNTTAAHAKLQWNIMNSCFDISHVLKMCYSKLRKIQGWQNVIHQFIHKWHKQEISRDFRWCFGL